MTTENQHDDTTDDAGHSYLCPYCSEAAYPTETLVRVHISYAADSSHAGRDGMTPEVEPLELDADGEQVGTAFTLPGQLNLHALTLEDIPTAYGGREFDERERRTLLVAAFNANRNLSATELQDRVTAHLEQRDLEPLPTRDLRQLCQHVFLPHLDDEGVSDEQSVDGTGITTAQTTLRDLTALQQAIILAHLARPDIDRTTLATRVGTANSYPTQVIETRSDLVARLRSRLEGERTLERLIADRVPEADFEELVDEGYLDAFDIDLQTVQERKRRHAESAGHTTAARATGAGGSEASGAGSEMGDERTDSSNGRDTATRHSVSETAPCCEHVPETTTDSECASDGVEIVGERGQTGPTVTASEGPVAEGDGDGTTGDSDSAATVPRAEVEAVREQVAFDLAVVEQEMELADPTPQQVRTKAYLEQLLERLDELLS